ncbi:MAG: amino acid permease [Candidatus Eremiobacteraeota bacterium]|nr:amino acid permease [Candidatus Eremiobacteraeota bacterium]
MNEVKPHAKLARKLGTFDATLIVMGGVIGSGVFVVPSVVAQAVHTAPLIMLVWLFGGLFALITGFVFAELARLRPDTGGLYGYVRDGIHPVVGFMYGWTALFVSQSGGMAAAALTFALYFSTITSFGVGAKGLAIASIVILCLVNCFGVREGGTTQNLFMILKIAAIAAIILVGIFAPVQVHTAAPLAPPAGGLALLVMLTAALSPVFFAYDGAQTAPLMDREVVDPGRTFPRALVLGVIGILALYLGISATALRVLGPGGLAATSTPAADIMRVVFGAPGERAVALAVAVSTLGFLSNQILVTPRIFFSMADDGLFFRSLAYVHPRTRAPIVAIVVTGIASIAIALSQSYAHVVDYVVIMDFIFFALCAISLYTLRRRGLIPAGTPWRIPLHPLSTWFFIAVCVVILCATIDKDPVSSLLGIGILCSGAPVYFIWQSFQKRKPGDIATT